MEEFNEKNLSAVTKEDNPGGPANALLEIWNGFEERINHPRSYTDYAQRFTVLGLAALSAGWLKDKISGPTEELELRTGRNRHEQ